MYLNVHVSQNACLYIYQQHTEHGKTIDVFFYKHMQHSSYSPPPVGVYGYYLSTKVSDRLDIYQCILIKSSAEIVILNSPLNYPLNFSSSLYFYTHYPHLTPNTYYLSSSICEGDSISKPLPPLTFIQPDTVLRFQFFLSYLTFFSYKNTLNPNLYSLTLLLITKLLKGFVHFFHSLYYLLSRLNYILIAHLIE